MFKAADYSKEEIQQLLADAWLNVDLRNTRYWNPLMQVPECTKEKPHLYYSWLMSQPEYFSFICKEIFNFPIYPMQGLILQQLWNHKFPILIGSRGLGKSSTLALYILLRLLLLPGRKVVITGASFRQSKVIFEYMERIWNEAPLLRDMCGYAKSQGPVRGTDIWTFNIGSSIAKALPMGDGEKIRGQRANDVIADEFASITRTIFEKVIMGFAAVNASPFEAMISAAARKVAKMMKIEMPKVSEYEKMKDNQIIISGTAYYSFNHFYDYLNFYKKTIYSKTKEPNLNYKDFCVMRIPYNLIPEGFMDADVVARAKATIQSSVYEMEYGCVFTKDSNGFFKRSLIEKCVANEINNIVINNEQVIFTPTVYGNKAKKYVIAIDPALEVDNFAIVVIEINETHRRIVYTWTTNKKDHREKLTSGYTTESNYYGYCAAKIRELMRVFPTVGIAIDAQGGGRQVMETLHDKDKIREDEQLLWEVVNPDKPLSTDHEDGLHIIYPCEFADYNWLTEANHGLRDDFANKRLLFPAIDGVDVALALKDDGTNAYDTLEDCIFEIEELKNELATIVMTATQAGRDRWDTPEIKTDGKKGRMRKDRYSALLMGAWLSKKLSHTAERVEYNPSIAWAYDTMSKRVVTNDKYFSGPKNIAKSLQDLY